MATITIDNTSTEQVAREFLYRINLDQVNDKINPDASIAAFVGKPSQTLKDFRDLHAYLETPEGQADVKSISATKAVIQTLAFSTPSSDIQVTINLSGNDFLTEGAGQVTSITNQYNFISYLSGNHVPSNIDVNVLGTETLKVSYNPSFINSVGDSRGNVQWSGATLSDKGYYHDDVLTKYNYTVSETMTGNMVLSTNDTISGLITGYKTSQTDTGSTSSSSRAINLVSKSGIVVNEKQEYSGTIDSLSISKINQSSSADAWSGGISYKETVANTQLANALTKFIANQANITELAAAMLNQNDKITAKGLFTTINGYLGNDAITLGNGSDTVRFSTSLNATSNVDKITGFKKAGNDHLSLDKTIFTGYNGSSNFVIGAKAIDADDRIIYDNKTGMLYYDADGTGSIAAVQFAILVGKPTLTANDIYTF